MAVVYHEIYLPIDTESTFDYIVIKQGDAGTHKVRATLISNNRVYTIPTSGASYFMKFRKPDNNYCLVEATVSDNTISAEVTEEMLRVSGTGRGEFMIVSGSNELKTATFHVKIVKETYTSEDVQSHSDFAPFAALLQGAGAAASNANAAAAAANAAASLAEQKAQAIPDDYSDLVAEVEEVKADLGNLSNLETESKTNLVSAINEAARSGLSDEAKEAILDCFRNVAWLNGTDGEESFEALLEAFGMSDFYNTWEWSYPGDLVMYKATPSFLEGSETDGILFNNNASSQKNRRFPCVNRGKLKCVEYEEMPGDIYPIPIPKEATSATVTIAPATMYLFLIRWTIQGGVYKIAGSKPWTAGTSTMSFDAASDTFLSINIKYNSSSNTEFATEPQGLEITFE